MAPRKERPRVAIEDNVEAFLAAGIAAFEQGLAEMREVLDIPPDLDPAEWVERHFNLSPETTGQVQPFKLYGYQRGMLQAMCDPECDELYMPKSTRTGVTQLGMAAAAYYIGHKHSQVMLVQPIEQKAQEFANDYLTPAFRDSELLAGLVRKPSKGERQDTWDNRLYSNGGMMRLGWAASDGTFRGRTAQILMGDEVDDDGWLATADKSQGDKFKLFKDRGKTRHGSRMIMWSSPLRRKTSLIWPQWEKSTKEYYFVPCPHKDCGHMQRLQWGSKESRFGIKPHYDDDGNLKGAFYMCEACEQLIEDDRATREWMDANGEWRATAAPTRRRVRGMHISALYSMAPKVSWTTLWEEWMEAQGDADKLKHFFNSNLGLPFDDVVVDQQVDPGSFAETRPEPYRAEMPIWTRRVTIGVDSQKGKDDPDKKDWLPPRHEVSVVAWGPGEESAVIGHFIIPATRPFDTEASKALDDIILRKWRREDGREFQAVLAAVDCSFMIDEAIAYCMGAHRARICVPVRGENETSVKLSPIVISKPGVHAQTGRQFTNIGTRTAKNALFRRLKIETPGPGYIHFPDSLAKAIAAERHPYAPYFDGLFAEKSFYDKKGVLHWEPIGSLTGEPWDCLVYALAALRIAYLRYPGLLAELAPPKEPRVDVRYEGPDMSAMAAVLTEKLLDQGAAPTLAADPARLPATPLASKAYAPPEEIRVPRQLATVRPSWGRR